MNRIPLCLVLTLLVVQHITASELRPLSLSCVTHGASRQCTFTYQSSTQATAIWGDQLKIYERSMANTTDTFRKGKGESTLLVSDSPPELYVFVFILGQLNHYLYRIGQIDGAVSLPDTHMTFPSGQSISYTPDVPFTATVQYLWEAVGYTQPEVSWYFIGIDNNRTDLTIELAGSWDPASTDFISNTTISTNGSSRGMSVQVNLQSQSGIAMVITVYKGVDTEPKIIHLEALYIHPAGYSLFPSDFIGIFNPYDLSGNGDIACTGSSLCLIFCYGVGYGIDRVELRKTGSDNMLTSYLESPTEWMYLAEYQLYPASEADSGTYTCTVFNNQGKTAQRELVVTVA